MQRSRIFLAVALAFALHGFGCGEPAVPALKVPEGLALEDLPAATRALLRATMEISHGALAETDVVLDPERLTLRGDFALQNVGNGGARTLTLRI